MRLTLSPLFLPLTRAYQVHPFVFRSATRTVTNAVSKGLLGSESGSYSRYSVESRRSSSRSSGTVEMSVKNVVVVIAMEGDMPILGSAVVKHGLRPPALESPTCRS